MSPMYTKVNKKMKKMYAGPSPYASNCLYAVFGYHSYQYANELNFTNVRLFYISNNW